MTAVALDMFAQPRAAAPQRGEQGSKELFSSLISQQVAQAPVDPAKQLLDGDAAAQNDALLALLQQLPQGELPSGGIPEAIVDEVSVVIDLPETLQEETRIAADSVIAEVIPQPKPALPAFPVRVLGSGLLPIAVDDEISDGVPMPIEGAPRARGKKPTADESAKTIAVPVPAHELMHARTMLAMPIVDGEPTIQENPMIPSNPTPSSRPSPTITRAIPALAVRVDQVAQTAAPSLPTFVQPLTPLEQAVQDLIADLAPTESGIGKSRLRDEPTQLDAPIAVNASIPEVKLISVEHADAPAPVTAIREPQEMPEQANPSHVHLVIDDGMERVVVTVAVRGSEVNVALRGQDDATNAALARNAGSLDHAMRARGLDLASLMTGKEHESQRDRPQRDQRDRKQATEQFSIEELV